MRVLFFLALLSLLVIPVSSQDDQRSSDRLSDDASGVTYVVETYVTANFPVGMAFAPDGRLFYNEKNTGSVRVVSADGVRQPEPVVSLPTDALQERGMLGIAVDPNFEENRTLWVVHTAPGTAADWPANRLVRFQVVDGQAENVEEMLRLPIDTGSLLHNGGNVHFDDDGHLYISFGDYGDPALAQDRSTLHGAIHRFAVTEDGLAPAEGNPYPAESTYAHGFRNPFDFTFEPQTGQLWTSENGPDCDDEINLVLPGFNYGWGPDYPCYGEDMVPDMPDYVRPLLSYTPTIGLSGITFYTGDAIPEWQGNLFFCDWTTGTLRRAELDDSRSRIDAVHEVALGDASCKLDVITGPDGALYFGSVGGGTGNIYRLRPAE